MARVPSLSPNGEKIIRQLITLPGRWVTSALLADSIGISKRTIMRELPGVEAWMAAVGADFKRSPGKGMMLAGEEGQIAVLRDLLGNSGDSIVEKDLRIQELFFLLILFEEPVKQFYLANTLGISERTLSTELDRLAPWLEKQGLHLMRKSGVGIWMEGSGYDKRRALSQLLYHQYSEEILKTLFGENESLSDEESFHKMLDSKVARKVKQILQAFEVSENLTFADSGFITLALQLTLLVQDLLKDKEKGIIHEKRNHVHCEMDQPCMADKLIKALEEAFQVVINQDQTEILDCYLDAYRSRTVEEGMEGSEMELRYLGAMLIQYVEMELNVDLSRHQDLSEAMYNHLRTMLHRMRTDSYTENPQLEMFKQQYGWLWDIIRRACDAAYEMQAYPGLKPISDEEAAFLGMHFGAVLARDDMALMRIKTVLVCPYGLASSRFLSSQITKEYPVLHIHSTCSVRELNEEYLRSAGVDLLISTVPLQIAFPYVQVNTILQNIDHTILNEAIAQCQRRIQERVAARKQRDSEQVDRLLDTKRTSRSLKEREDAKLSVIRRANRLSGLIIDFIDHLEIESAAAVGKRDKLIRKAAELFARDEESANVIEAALLRREEIASTYVQPLRVLLLHAKSDQISGCRMGYIKAEPPVYEPGKLIQGAIIVLASDNDDYATDIIRAVCGMLIDVPELMEVLNQKNLNKSREIIENRLEMYFLYRFNEAKKALKENKK